MSGQETVFTFTFPVEETFGCLGLAKYVFLAYHKDTFSIRFFLLELDRRYNGEEWRISQNVVEYRYVDTTSEEVQFIREIYR